MKPIEAIVTYSTYISLNSDNIPYYVNYNLLNSQLHCHI